MVSTHLQADIRGSPITISYSSGAPLTRALLSETYYPSKISRVIIITRDSTSAKAKALIELGAEAIQASDDSAISAENLKGVDVLINALSVYASAETVNHYAKAAADAKVKIYFPPEFGV